MRASGLIAVALCASAVGALVAATIVFQDAWSPAAQGPMQQGWWVPLIFALPMGALVGFLSSLLGIVTVSMLPARQRDDGSFGAGIAGLGVFVFSAGIVELLTAMSVLQHFEIAWWIAIGLPLCGSIAFVWWLRTSWRSTNP